MDRLSRHPIYLHGLQFHSSSECGVQLLCGPHDSFCWTRPEPSGWSPVPPGMPDTFVTVT
jgi:hypothetical protein